MKKVYFLVVLAMVVIFITSVNAKTNNWQITPQQEQETFNAHIIKEFQKIHLETIEKIKVIQTLQKATQFIIEDKRVVAEINDCLQRAEAAFKKLDQIIKDTIADLRINRADIVPRNKERQKKLQCLEKQAMESLKKALGLIKANTSS